MGMMDGECMDGGGKKHCSSSKMVDELLELLELLEVMDGECKDCAGMKHCCNSKMVDELLEVSCWR